MTLSRPVRRPPHEEQTEMAGRRFCRINHLDFCASPETVLAEFLDLCRARVPEVEVIRPVLGEYVEL